MAQIVDFVVRVGADTRGAQSGLHAIQQNLRTLERICELFELRKTTKSPLKRLQYSLELLAIGVVGQYHGIQRNIKQSYKAVRHILTGKPTYTINQLRWLYPEAFEGMNEYDVSQLRYLYPDAFDKLENMGYDDDR